MTAAQSCRNRIAGCGRNRLVGHASDALRLSASRGTRLGFGADGPFMAAKHGFFSVCLRMWCPSPQIDLNGRFNREKHDRYDSPWKMVLHYFQTNPSGQRASTSFLHRQNSPVLSHSCTICWRLELQAKASPAMHSPS